MIPIENITDNISCFKVPYKDIFVGIYVLRAETGVVLFDTAATDADMDNWIVPALEQLGVTPTHIFISHNHRDHAGGLARAAALYPDAVILSRSPSLAEAYPQVQMPEDSDTVLDVFQVVTIPGHTEDSAGLLDTRTNTLVSGDCLQVYGIYGSGDWYGNISYPAAHFAAIEKLRKLPIDTIAAAHDYHPCGMISTGKNQVTACLDNCIGALRRVLKIVHENPQMDDAEIATVCNDGTLPKIAPRIVGILRKAAEENTIK